MGQGARVRPTRRDLLAAGAGLLAGCGERRAPGDGAAALAGARWLGASHERGHRLHAGLAASTAAGAVPRRCSALVVGGGVAGLAALRALRRAGIDDAVLLELEDQPGGNARGHVLGGQGCPLGAHYLPVPGEAAREVNEWLHEIGLLAQRGGRSVVADERHLCHSPQERLFFEGAWHEGLLPPAAPGSATLAQYRRFATRVDEVQRTLGFAIPTRHAGWSPGHAALDAQTFGAWLAHEGLHDPQLRWYLDYACRDDYGAGLDEVSAWAGLHYFASRHGFHAPGDEAGEREGVFTWPEGNAWLVERLAAPVRAQVQGGRIALRVEVQRHGVQVLAAPAAGGPPQAWSARAVVLACPLFVAARLLTVVPPALAALLPRQQHAPWVVANLQLREPLLDRGLGAPAAWDNVRFGSASLGYVDAGHQRLAPTPRPTVLTSYWAVPRAQRGELLAAAPQDWAARVLAELQPLHPDLPAKLVQLDLMRYGHAMSIPTPGLRSSPALEALANMTGRLLFAHSDLAAYSVFEEAFTQGDRAGRAAVAALKAR
ncbi:MAG: FAD-dependent oxidoreductase [Burkholderiales bacterium]|nr:FAD-dependent oxidoreductase [Burkholderiales bacterium]